MSRYHAASVAELEEPVGDQAEQLPDEPAEELPILHFSDGIPGFPGCTDFVLTDIAPDSAFQVLQCLQDETVSMIVTVPWLFFPDYEPEVTEAEREQLELTSPEDAIVFCPVTLAPEEDTVYLNLMGPFVVNQRTLRGRQLVLADSGHSTRAPVRLADL